jgi:ferrochelatase
MTDGVIVVGFGGPERREDVIPFLEHVLAGVPVPRGRIEEVASHYHHFGGRSPINAHTFAQARSLAEALSADGLAVRVVVGNRHWKPFAIDAVRELADRGVKRAAGVVLAAHRSGAASYDKYVRAVEEARRRVGASAPEVTYIESFHVHPGFIDAVADRMEEAAAALDPERRRNAVILFTAHSIPRAAADSSPYVTQLEESCRAAAGRTLQARWRLVYQSRSGRPEDPWLEPDVCDALKEEAARGTRDVIAVPIGFLSDHMEVLYDLDVEAAAVAREAGLHFLRARTVLDHPRFIRALADAVLALR